MSIGTAVQRGSNWVYVYDESGRQITTIAGQLYGFTGSTVSVPANTRSSLQTTNVYCKSHKKFYSPLEGDKNHNYIQQTQEVFYDIKDFLKLVLEILRRSNRLDTTFDLIR